MILTQDLRKTVVKGHEDQEYNLIDSVHSPKRGLIHMLATLI